MREDIKSSLCRRIWVILLIFITVLSTPAAFAASAKVEAIGEETNNNAAVNAKGKSAWALHADDGGILNQSGDVTATATKWFAFAAEANNNSKINVSGDIAATGRASASGVNAYGNSSVTVSGGVSAAAGVYARGVGVFSGSSVEIGEGINVTSDSNGSFGAVVNDGKLTVKRDIAMSGNHGIALDVSNDASADIGGSVKVTGVDSLAVRSVNSTVKIGGDIVATGKGAEGMYTAGSDITIGGGVTVNGGSGHSYGVHAVKGSSVEIGEGIQVAGGNGSYGAYVNDSKLTVKRDIVTAGHGSVALNVSDNASADIGGNVKITGDGALAVHATDSTVKIGKDIVATGDGTDGLYTAGSDITIGGGVIVSGGSGHSYSVHAINDSSVEIGEGIQVAGGNGSYGAYVNNSKLTVKRDIVTAGHGSVALNVSGDASADIGGSVKITGDESLAVHATDSTVKIGEDIVATGDGTDGLYTAASDITIGGGVIVSGGSGHSFGVHADKGSSVEIGEGIQVAGGDGSYGAYVNDSKLTVKRDIVTAGHGSIALNVWDNASADIGGSVKITGDESLAVQAIDSTVKIGKDIVATGDGADGLFAAGSDITIGGGVIVSGDSAESYGVHAINGSTVEIGEGIQVTGGGVSYGANVDNSKLTVKRDIAVSGDNAFGLAAVGDAIVNIGGSVKVTGSDSLGVGAARGTVNISGDIVVSGGPNSYGVHATQGSMVEVGSGIQVTGNSSSGAYVEQSKLTVKEDVVVSGDNSYAIAAVAGSTVSIDKDVKVTGDNTRGVVAGSNNTVVSVGGGIAVSGDNAIGVIAHSGGTVNVHDVSVEGTSSTALLATYSGLINVHGATISGSGANSALMRTEEGGVISLDASVAEGGNPVLLYTESGGTVNASNGTILVGHVINYNDFNAGDELTIALNSGSSLTGAIYASGMASATNLLLSSYGEVWNVTGDSDLGGGTLENSGIVNFFAAPGYTTVTTGHLGAHGATGGLFAMKTDIVAEKSDELIVTRTIAGDYLITAQPNDGAARSTGNEVVTLIETADQAGSFALIHDIDLGAWTYSLSQTLLGSGGARWQLRSTGISNPASSALNTFVAGYYLGIEETQTLIQRLGDLRETPDASGLWARVYGGKVKADSLRYMKPFDMKFGGVQIGYDYQLDADCNWDSYIGVMFGYSQGDLDFTHPGDGDVDSKMVGVYGTFKNRNGFYVDAIAKYFWTESDFETVASDNEQIKGREVSGNGYGLSVEMGKRINCDDTREDGYGWYLEPQVQLSYVRNDGGYYRISNNLKLGIDDYTSLLGRAGLLVGYETERSNFYATISHVKEFDGDMDIFANNIKSFSESLESNWWVWGIGYTSKLNDRNSIYIDIERASGGNFSQPWRVNAGWRLTF